MLSIIIPTHNEENYLPKLLKCIKKQDHKDYEIIVGDSFSTDKTIKIARNYGCRIIKDLVQSGGPSKGQKTWGEKKNREERNLYLGWLNTFLAVAYCSDLTRLKKKNALGSFFFLPRCFCPWL